MSKDNIVREVLTAAEKKLTGGSSAFVATGTGTTWREFQGFEVSPSGKYWGPGTSKWTFARERKMSRMLNKKRNRSQNVKIKQSR